MSWLRDFLFTVALAAWTGSGLFFTFVATPAVFARFERAMAGEVVGSMFPGYFRLAVAAALVWAVASWARAGAGRPAAGWMLALAAVALACNLVGAWVLQPRIHELRLQLHPPGGQAPADEALTRAFGRLHGLSMGLNLLSVAAAVAAWAVLAAKGL